MDPGLRTAASGMLAQQLRIDVIANNLANVNTTAFKRSRVVFEDVLYQTLQGARVIDAQGGAALSSIQVGRGVRTADIQRVHSQGSAESTNRPLDVAIDGEGFFQVALPDGATAFTRAGSFTSDQEGAVRTVSGYTIEPPIVLPVDTTAVTISQTGVVTVRDSLGGDAIEVGRIELVRFANASGLESIGGNLYRQSAASGQPLLGLPQEDGFGRLIQHALEASNVEIVQEMVDMITAQRAYEINARAIQTSEEMVQIASGLIR